MTSQYGTLQLSLSADVRSSGDVHRVLTGHGAFSTKLYKEIVAKCGDPAAGEMSWSDPLSAECQTVVNEMNERTGE